MEWRLARRSYLRATAFRHGSRGLWPDRLSSPAAAQRCAEGAGLDSTDECQATLKPAGMGVALTLSVKSSPGFYKGKATVARRSRAVSDLCRGRRVGQAVEQLAQGLLVLL